MTPPTAIAQPRNSVPLWYRRVGRRITTSRSLTLKLLWFVVLALTLPIALLQERWRGQAVHV